jgi:hypothetical protein
MQKKLQIKRTVGTVKPAVNLICDQSLSSEESVRNKGMPDGVSGSVDTEQKSPTEPGNGLRRTLWLWPWAWLAVTGVVTLGWLIGICWAGFELVRWLAG